MIGRSLAFRIYLYAVAAFALFTIGGSWVVNNWLADDRRQVAGQFMENRARYVVSRLHDLPRNGLITVGKITELEAGLGITLERVPWHETNRYPQALRQQSLVPEAAGRNGGFARVYWAKVTRPEGPPEAVRIRFASPFGERRPTRTPVPMMMGLMALLLLPPLVLWVIRPINQLEAAAKRLGEGDLETPFPLRRNDELGRLAASFEHMRRQIKRMLEDKERLLGDISHELRGPIGRMGLALTLLEEDLGANPYLDKLQRELVQMEAMVGELLALARYRLPETLTLLPVRLDAITQALIDERQLDIAQHGHHLDVQLDPAPCQGDAKLLGRAIGNLLDNALKYTRSGGRITVSAGIQGETAFIRIRDDGIGIPANAIPHLFEPFYRPDTARTRETGGTGLGLAIVKAVVDRHGGQIELTSSEGAGTTAEMRLPAGTEARPG